MQLTSEGLLPFPGQHGISGLCHIRVYETPGQRPVVIAGQLEDNPGTAIDNAIESIAGLIQGSVIQDAREFQLLTYHNFGGPPYRRVEFEHRPLGDHQPQPDDHDNEIVITDGHSQTTVYGALKLGDFRNPAWHPVPDITALLGTTPAEWEQGEYTTEKLFGAQGARLHDQIAAEAHAAGDQLSQRLN